MKINTTKLKSLNKMNKKVWGTKAVSISIILLVLVSLMLGIVGLAFFYLQKGETERVIGIPGKMDNLYLKEMWLNFYLQDVFDKSVKDLEESRYKVTMDGKVNYYPSSVTDEFLSRLISQGANVIGLKEISKNEFINNYKIELNSYKDKNGDYSAEGLDEVEEQIVTGNIEITEEKLVLKLGLKLKESYIHEDQLVFFDYNYKKEFSKAF